MKVLQCLDGAAVICARLVCVQWNEWIKTDSMLCARVLEHKEDHERDNDDMVYDRDYYDMYDSEFYHDMYPWRDGLR